MGEREFVELEDILGHHFRDTRLLAHALTHSSRRNDLECSNERLEFLGDAVLGVVVSEHLYHTFPDYTEGDLTRVKSIAVSRETLVEAARDLHLEEFLIVGKGVARVPEAALGTAEESSASQLPESLLSDAFEAVIAAIYLDGGFQAAEDFIMRHMMERIEESCRTGHGQNYKSILQQVAQRTMGTVPVYRVTAEEGPDHVKWFTVVASIAGTDYGVGGGRTKKAAEQEAAERALALLAHQSTTGDAEPSDE